MWFSHLCSEGVQLAFLLCALWYCYVGRHKLVSNWVIVFVIVAFNTVTEHLDTQGQVSKYSLSVSAWTERRRLTTRQVLMKSPSWELCKYFHPLPQPADRLIPLTFLINHWGVDGRNWISGHTAVVGSCPHQHRVCSPILSSPQIHMWAHVHRQVKIDWYEIS